MGLRTSASTALTLLALILVLFQIPVLAAAAPPATCGDVTSSITLTGNLLASGTCFKIKANGITIDGAGYTITYAQYAEGYGIDNSGGYDNIVIKNLKIKHTNSSNENSYAIYAVGMTGSTIEGNQITTNGFYDGGIFIKSANALNTISGNTVTMNNQYSSGVRLESSDNQVVQNNNINTPSFWSPAINIISSDSSTISGNTITTGDEGSFGIRLETSTLSTITANTLDTKQDYAIYIVPSTTSSHYKHTIATSNTENGRAIHYYYQRAAPIQNLNNLGQLYVADSSGVQITNVNVSGDGITLAMTSNAQITNSKVSMARSEKQPDGINLHSGSNNNIISNNYIKTFGGWGYGIYLKGSENTLIDHNTLDTWGTHAIYIEPTSNSAYYNHDIRTTNTERGEPIYYFYNQNSMTFENIDYIGQLY
ncbi:MAG: right-handed parallel beta-helix repeat-containing protein, partial [archaeon]